MLIPFEELLNPKHKEPPNPGDVTLALTILKRALFAQEGAPTACIYDWDKVDPVIRRVFCFNGGDEDYLVTSVKKFEALPGWLDHMAADGDPDVYLLPDFVVYVTSHA